MGHNIIYSSWNPGVSSKLLDLNKAEIDLGISTDSPSLKTKPKKFEISTHSYRAFAANRGKNSFILGSRNFLIYSAQKNSFKTSCLDCVKSRIDKYYKYPKVDS